MADLALDVTRLVFTYRRTTDDGVQPFTLRVHELDLQRGEQVLLTAASGTGKTTLLNLIAGIIDPDEGTVRVAGKTMHAAFGAERDSLRGRSIGMIFQTFHLLTGFSAIENVMAALLMTGVPEREHRGRAKALLDRLGIARIDGRIEEMSTGQQQRVAVARALVCEPALVLADEPTASLDPENAMGAMDLIQQVCKEKNAALLCVSHDPSMPMRFERKATLASLAVTGVLTGAVSGAGLGAGLGAGVGTGTGIGGTR